MIPSTTARYSKIFLAGILVGLLLPPTNVNAIAPKDISSQESILSQGVSGDEATAPYMLNGESLVGMLQDVIGADIPGTSVVFNRKTGQIFVKTIPAHHQLVEQVLEDLRKTKRRQIDIETRIITVAGTDFEGLGAQLNSFNFLSSDSNLNEPGTSPIFGSGTVGSKVVTSTPTRTVFPDLSTIFGAAPLGGSFAVGIRKAGEFDLNAFINALSRTADVNTLAAPNIMVFNNQQANISIKKQKFYISEVTTSFETRTVGDDNVLTATQEADIDIAPSGTVLDVTPTINSNGSITLELHPTFVKSDITNTQAISAGIVGDSITLPVYTSQQINTTVSVENGGVVVLGGLISEEEINEHDSVPGLSKIPVLGKLFFQSNQVRNIKTHLLIFVKATIKNSTSL